MCILLTVHSAQLEASPHILTWILFLPPGLKNTPLIIISILQRRRLEERHLFFWKQVVTAGSELQAVLFQACALKPWLHTASPNKICLLLKTRWVRAIFIFMSRFVWFMPLPASLSLSPSISMYSQRWVKNNFLQMLSARLFLDPCENRGIFTFSSVSSESFWWVYSKLVSCLQTTLKKYCSFKMERPAKENEHHKSSRNGWTDIRHREDAYKSADK